MQNEIVRLAELIVDRNVVPARELAHLIGRSQPQVATIAHRALDSLDIDAAGARLQVATLYLLGGARDRAVALALELLTPDATPATRTSVATIYMGAERFSEAREQLEAVLAGDPDNRDAHQNLAAAAFRLGDIGTAVTAYSRAFDLDPTDVTPLHNMIEMLAQVGKWVGALSALSLVRRGEPPPEVAVALDLAAIQLTQLAANMFPAPKVDAESDQVVSDLLANVTRRSVRSQLVAAKALADVGRFADAATLANQLAKSPALEARERADLHYLEGLLAEQNRDRNRAVARYTEAIASDPTRTDAATNALSLLVAHGTPDSLLQVEPLLARLDPGARATSPTLAFNEARYIRKSARPIADARACLERVLELTGGSGNLADLAREALEELSRL